MKFIKKAIACLAVAVLGICAASCAGGGNTDKNDVATITIGVVSDSVESGIINKLKDAFLAKEENKDIKIKTVKIVNGYDSWVLNKMTTKTLPDMIQVYDFNSRYWTNENLFQSVTDLMQKDGINVADYNSSVMDMAKSGSDDNYYWLPRDYNKMVVCINTEMFEAAGIAKPSDDWTMTDFYNVCKQLKAKESEIKALTKQTTFFPAEMKLNSTEIYYPYMRAYGGDLFDEKDGKVSVYKDLDKVKQGVNELLKYADEGLALQPDTSALAFTNKQAAMIFTSRPNVSSYAKNLNNKIDFVSMPTIQGVAEGEKSYIGMGCTGYTLTSACPESKRESAWRFLKFIVSEEGQEVLGATGSGIPVLNSLLENKNAAWRKFISADLNHDAFCKFSERDLPAMSYMDKVPVAKQLTVYNTLDTKLLKEIYESDARDDYYISNLKATLDRNLAN